MTYRNNAKKTNDSFGLMKATKDHNHTCSPPGISERFFHWITFSPIREGSLWRCDFCWQTWKADIDDNSYDGNGFRWLKATNEEWDNFK